MKFFTALLVIAVIAVAKEKVTAKYLLVEIEKGKFCFFLIHETPELSAKLSIT